ncbi:hypothetical protein BJV82DRAFT_508097, partial [Fennellomyces sp. T-0311]
PNVMLGYKGNREATANAIDDDNLLYGSDIVRKDEEGHVSIVGRIKELLKYKGFQITSVELESVILQSSYVADAGVIDVEGKTQNTQIPLAFVTFPDDLKNQASTLPDKIRLN